MKHQTLVAAFCIAAGCTYNEYKNYYTTSEEGTLGGSDAGVDDTGRSGSSGAGGSSSVGAAGSAGSGSAGSAGSGDPASADCTGCERIRVLSSRVADYQLDFDSRRDLSNALVLFRVRVRDYVGSVSLVAYVESGDHLAPEQGFAPDAAGSYVTLTADSGWQDVGLDLQQQPAFRAPTFEDAGGTAGAGFDPGFPFDKARVRRVGLRIQPNEGSSGVFTPATLELDSVSFSTADSLNVDFSTGPGGFELVDPESATLSHVPG